jgi:NAD(P)-dependent dehydrogenase (short-subunit alcohol dehydrogenase family)
VSRRLQDRIAIVTGAGSIGPGWGNGKAAAVLFAREGAKIVAMDINASAAKETAEIIVGEGGECIPIVGDVANAADIQRVVDTCCNRYGRIDILHNNVGIVVTGGAAEVSEEDWDRVMAVNLKGVFLACRAVLPIMEKGGRGTIVNVSSVAAIRYSGVNYITYYTSKGAVLPFTRAVALEYARKGIRANTILPGMMDTPLIYHSLTDAYASGDAEEMVRVRNAQCPMGHMGDAWDVAHAALFLASDEAKYITGAEFVVDGGLTCKFA